MNKLGILEMTVGPVFSGKSSWLIKKLEELKKNNTPHLAINFKNDNRYSKDAISSHDKTHYKSIRAQDSLEIRNLLAENPSITHLVIDEVQFFDKELANLVYTRMAKKYVQLP